MMYFNTRAQARVFANRTGRRVTDRGTEATRRWGVSVIA